LTVDVIPLDVGAPMQAPERGAELLLLPCDMALKELETLPILKDHLAGLIWIRHFELGEQFEISEAEYRAARHIISRDERMPMLTFERRTMALLSARRIAMRTSSQATLPSIIMGSDLIATGGSWLSQTAPP
jgi:hypothetical protein